MKGRKGNDWESYRPELIDQVIRQWLQIPESKPIPQGDKDALIAAIEEVLATATPLAQVHARRLGEIHDILQAGREAAKQLRSVMTELAEFHADYGFEFSQLHEDLRHLGDVFDQAGMAGASLTENESPTYTAVEAVEVYCTMVQAHLPQDKGGTRDIHTFILGSPMGQFVANLATLFARFNPPAQITGTKNGPFHEFSELLLELAARRPLTVTEENRLLYQIQFSGDLLRRRYEALEDARFWRRNRDLLRHHDDPQYGDQRSEEADRLYREARHGRPRPPPSKKK